MKRIDNKKARFEYAFASTYEAGIVLRGDEIKAIRLGKISLQGSYCKIIYSKSGSPELWLINAHISSAIFDPTRTRKLLMHRHEIDKLVGATTQKGLTIVPVKLYFKKGKAKLEIALARGRKVHDKRELIKKRDLQREQQQYHSNSL